MAKAKKSAGLAFRTTPERYAEIVRGQREMLHGLADKIERGETLEAFEPEIAAAIIRAHADRMAAKRGPGQQSPLDATVAIEYVNLRTQGEKHDVAIDLLMKQYGAKRSAITAAVRKHREAAESWAALSR